MNKLVSFILKFLVSIFFKLLFFVQGRTDTTPALKRAVGFYSNDSFGKLFTQIRIWDAPLTYIEKLVPKAGLILDLGCGDGFLANFLAIAGPNRKIIGIEINANRIASADHDLKNVKFTAGDVTKQKFPMADAIVLIDVLHHLSSFASQEKLLAYCSSRINKGGKLIISEIVKKPFLKYAFTYLTDAMIFPILFEKKFFTTDFFYRDTWEWKSLLIKYGFKVIIKEAHLGKPFSHKIFICQKHEKS